MRAVPRAALACVPLLGALLCVLSSPARAGLAAALIGVVSVAAYFVAHALIEAIIPSLLKAGMFGKDLSKTSEAKVTEWVRRGRAARRVLGRD